MPGFGAIGTPPGDLVIINQESRSPLLMEWTPTLVAVLIANLLLSAVCLFVAWKIWQFRRALSRAADALLSAERVTHRVLYRAPEFLLKGQTGSRGLRSQYRDLQSRLQRLEQVLSLINSGLLLWRRSTVSSSQTSKRGRRPIPR